MPPKFSRESIDRVIYSGSTSYYQMRTSPCEISCPAGIAVQKMLSLIEKNRFEEALDNLRAVNPLPSITSSVCNHPCEQVCNRRKFDKALSIRALEQSAARYGGEIRLPEKKAQTGKNVAVIGGGPAGLTCSYFLALLGNSVTLFEALPVLGGIPRNVFSDELLSKKAVDSDISRIIDMGVEVKTGTRIGKDILFKEIEEKYDAALIAVGAAKPPVSDYSMVDTNSSWMKQLVHEKNIDFIKGIKGIGFGPDNKLETDQSTMVTGKYGLFAAGAVIKGADSVARAVGNGRRAAISIDACLQGESIHDIRSVCIDSSGDIIKEKFYSGTGIDHPHVVSFTELRNLEYFKQKQGRPGPGDSTGADGTSGTEKDLLNKEESRAEASLCFHCGHCFSCGTCVDICPGDVLAMVDSEPRLAYAEECIHCGACMIDCPSGAIHFHIPLPMTISAG